MSRFIFLVGITLGWWLGSQIGLVTAFILSSIGSIAGLYFGWRIYRDYLD